MTTQKLMTLAMLLKPEETARFLGISRSKAYGMISAGELPAIRCGKSVRVPREALERWIEANTTGGNMQAAK